MAQASVAEAPKRILGVALGRQLSKKIDPLLNRAYFAVDHVPRGESALVLCRRAAFDLILVGHPLPDMPLEKFLVEVAPSDAAAASPSQLLVLTEERRLVELPDSVRSGPHVAVAIEQPQKLLEEVASRLLKVAPRLHARLLVKLEVRCGGQMSLVACQSENLSESGMLVRTDAAYPIGTTLSFEFTTPQDPKPLRGQAEVVRHTLADMEQVRGVGLKLTHFEGDGRERLEAYVASVRPPDDSGRFRR
jgi:uncharacterized protein (TIGR02266 family)